VLNFALLAAFIPTFFAVSLTPGLCMTLAMSLGISIGVRKTLWMMLGELLGVGLVASAVMLGISAVFLAFPEWFALLRWAGGLYMAVLGIQLWRSRGRLALMDEQISAPELTRTELWLQGLVTAIANPKGWLFFAALLPPFIDPSRSFVPQLMVLLGLILTIEFLCLLLYANGGQLLRKVLLRRASTQWLNRLSGTLMLAVALWLILF
jgi:threonine/homoserine/homoserine lactone efflux protein